FNRHDDRDLEAAAGHRPEAAAGAAAEARVEPLADIGQSDTGPFVGGRRELLRAAVFQPVADFHDHSAVVDVPRLDPDHDRLAVFRNTIFDRILDDGLKQ